MIEKLKLLERLFREYYIVQNFDELCWLVEKVSMSGKEKGAPTAILEIGIEKGGTLKVWEQLLKQDKNSILIGIDVNPSVNWDIKESNVKIEIIKGNSHDENVLNDVKNILIKMGDREFDFIYIDGEHTSSAAKMDFEWFSKLVRKNGLVGFHDIGDIAPFFTSLPQDRVEMFSGKPPYKEIGWQRTIGTGIFHL